MPGLVKGDPLAGPLKEEQLSCNYTTFVVIELRNGKRRIRVFSFVFFPPQVNPFHFLSHLLHTSHFVKRRSTRWVQGWNETLSALICPSKSTYTWRAIISESLALILSRNSFGDRRFHNEIWKMILNSSCNSFLHKSFGTAIILIKSAMNWASLEEEDKSDNPRFLTNRYHGYWTYAGALYW